MKNKLTMLACCLALGALANVKIVPEGAAQVERDGATGRVTVRDNEGNVLLRETRRTADEVAFESPEGERLYGMGQFQDGAVEIRNLPRTLIQVNTQASVPLLHSSRGWSVLFDTARRIDFNPCDNFIALAETGETRKCAEANGLYGRYLDETAMDGAFEVAEAGEYAFMLDAGTLPKSLARRHVVEIDGKAVVEERNFQTPPNRGFIVPLAAGRHTVRVWRGVDDKPTLAWRKCGNETVVRIRGGGIPAAGPSGDKNVAAPCDYTVFVGTIAENIAAYRKLTGGTAALPDWAFGYWHCRERFHSQRELLETAREFKRRGYPVAVIVQDWQWWRDKTWNSMEWDPKRFPDPKAMTDELHALGMKFMLSVWSKTEGNTPFANEMRAAGGFVDDTPWIDFTNPAALAVYWKWMERNVIPAGVDAWWFDAVEPEDDALHGKRLFIGDGDAHRNAYPLIVNEETYRHLAGLADSACGACTEKTEGTETRRMENSNLRVSATSGSSVMPPAGLSEANYLALTRCFFTGQNRVPCVLWSGDVGGGWDDLRKQVAAGLGASLSGVPWWTSDAGGFFRPKDQYTNEAYKRLMVRWFEFATFCGVQRLHGFMSETEPWRYGEETERILRKYIELRQTLMPYILECARDVAANDGVLMRPLVLDFADEIWGGGIPAADGDKNVAAPYEFMFGPRYLVAPVVADVEEMEVYLPRGVWRNYWTGEVHSGGQTLRVAVPLDTIPLFERLPASEAR